VRTPHYVNQRHSDPLVEHRPAGYNVHTGSDVLAMLETMGLRSVEQLFKDIPAGVRLRRELELPPALSEWELQRDVRAMAAMNTTAATHSCFAGAGAYDHYVPAVVDAICSRGEFLTAYTPYQPEMSQGLLQALFEFQTLVGRLLGRECVNCSVYDGATALAEACWMMCSSSGQRRVIVPRALFAEYGAVLETYLTPRGVALAWADADAKTGLTELESVRRLLAQGKAAGVVLQSPNAFGVVEDVAALSALCAQEAALLCVSVNPMLCGWIEAPGQLGADIVCCEGQPLGLPLSGGGPYVGIIACAKPLERFLPGRLVGRVHDLNGKLGYALVKEDREQHVARDQATSHICSNQALNAIRVAVYLACLGEANFMRIAEANAARAALLRQRLTALDGVKPLRTGAHFNEFSLELPIDARLFCARMHERGVLAGVPVAASHAGHDRGLLVAVTETRSLDDLDFYVAQASQCLAGAAQ
jgi:glycine cleavage system P protein (glycine dehydrogenase) subunit 1